VAVVVIAFLPGISPLLAAVAAVALVIAEVLVYRRGLRVRSTALYAGLAALAIGAVVFALSRTGGPLCEPDSLFQGHALWHVLTATALALWAVTALPEVER
jgi:predicted membrane channel-forming protein YqfA (hemolysin III family)